MSVVVVGDGAGVSEDGAHRQPHSVVELGGDKGGVVVDAREDIPDKSPHNSVPGGVASGLSWGDGLSDDGSFVVVTQEESTNNSSPDNVPDIFSYHWTEVKQKAGIQTISETHQQLILTGIVDAHSLT